MNREEVLYQDFSARLQPRIVWDSMQLGTFRYTPKPQKQKHRMTEVEYNAEGRRKRRIQNRLNRGWLPYAKR